MVLLIKSKVLWDTMYCELVITEYITGRLVL